MTLQIDKLITAEEFDALGDIGRADLIRGKVVFLTKARARHGRIAMEMGRLVANFVKSRNLGEVYAAETGYVIEHNPDTVRAPDVSFVRAELVLGHDEAEWYPHSPDLAVEVLSPTDRPGAVREKVQMWLDGGGRSVWVVDPALCTVVIHRASGASEEIAEDGELRDESVLPGFVVKPMGQIFER